jgi:exopolysaccharide production protein ExoZ
MEWFPKHFEVSRGGNASGVRPMEGLRGFAVFLVFLVHYVTVVKPWLAPDSSLMSIADGIHTIGNTGVDLFFVLSGYLIYGSLISRPLNLKRFMFRRIIRIYPAFIAVFVVYLALSFALPSMSKIPKTTLQGSIYLIQNFLLFPGLFPIAPMIIVAWSLSYEMFYYLVMPLIIIALGLRRRNYLWRGGLFLLIAVAILFLCATLVWPIRLARLVMFIAGILLYDASQSGRVPTPSNSIAVLALVSGLLAMLLPWTGSDGSATKVAILFVSFFIVCFSCFSDPGTWLPRMFSWTPLRWLGNMSYSYYLLHGLSLKAIFLLFAVLAPATVYGPLFFWTLLPVTFGLTLIPASALFLLIEHPISLAPGVRQRVKPDRGIVSD